MLLIPIWLVFGWIHLRVFATNRTVLDGLLVTIPFVLALSLGFFLLHHLASGPGLWGEIMAALSAYLTLATGFGLALAVRRFLVR